MKGIYTAIITPFDRTGKIDWDAFDRLLDLQIQSGVQGIVFCGTTGESPTLSKNEKRAVFEFGLKKLRGTTLVAISGIGSNDTEETVRTGKIAEEIGFKTHLVVTPYYNKPTQIGLLKHYEKIHNELSGNIILYNVPGRTGVSLTAETVGTLSRLDRITAIKEATGNIDLGRDILKAVSAAGGKLDLMSGDDATFLPLLQIGAVGTISVASHIAPRALVQMVALFNSGKTDEAKKIHDRLLPWFRDLFIESNPSPVKWVLARLGVIQNSLRLPLVELSDPSAKQLEKLLAIDPKIGGEWS